MKKLLLIALTAGLTFFVWTRQHAHCRSIILENERLAATLNELEARARRADSARETAEHLSDDLRAQLTTRKSVIAQATASEPPAYTPPAKPDASRQGGWPGNTPYFYLPKEYLTNAHYKLLEGGRLTDEAATLLGMSPAERSTVNQLFNDLFSQFRQLEVNNLIRITPPEWWQGATFGAKLESAVACQIPALSAGVDAARQSFSQQLQQTLGNSRAQLLNQETDAYLFQHMDNLGADERVIGFLTATENDGSHTVWYGISDARHGGGSFQRVPADLAPDSQIAYYANLLGVQLPGKQ